MNPQFQTAFYFIPDISGFSNFVENTAVEHSIHIISELLEILLDNNNLDMKLAEVEGDALFMYTENYLQFQEVEIQVREMLNAFLQHLQRYEHQRICDCCACSSAIDLKLKFLVHYGRLDFIQVKDIKKPYGQDVNRIHRLLKNEVPLKEYLLLSHLAFQEFRLNKEEIGFKKLKSDYDIQILPYYYKPLDSYKEDISVDRLKKSKIGIEKNAEIVVEKEIAAPIHTLYEFISNFKYRKSWDDSLSEIHFEQAKVNRVGTQHNCIIGNKKLAFETGGDLDFKADKVYTEKTRDVPMTSNYHYYILLDSLSENRTRVKVLNFVKLDWLGRSFKKRVYKRIQKSWTKKLKNLEEISQKKL